jgi:trimeric autotransporter adhesin
VAAYHGKQELVRLLLLHKAQPAATDADARTPLHYAALKSHEQCVQLLLQAGASPGISDSKGTTAEMLLGGGAAASDSVSNDAIMAMLRNAEGRAGASWAARQVSPRSKLYTSTTSSSSSGSAAAVAVAAVGTAAVQKKELSYQEADVVTDVDRGDTPISTWSGTADSANAGSISNGDASSRSGSVVAAAASPQQQLQVSPRRSKSILDNFMSIFRGGGTEKHSSSDSSSTNSSADAVATTATGTTVAAADAAATTADATAAAAETAQAKAAATVEFTSDSAVTGVSTVTSIGAAERAAATAMPVPPAIVTSPVVTVAVVAEAVGTQQEASSAAVAAGVKSKPGSPNRRCSIDISADEGLPGLLTVDTAAANNNTAASAASAAVRTITSAVTAAAAVEVVADVAAADDESEVTSDDGNDSTDEDDNASVEMAYDMALEQVYVVHTSINCTITHVLLCTALSALWHTSSVRCQKYPYYCSQCARYFWHRTICSCMVWHHACSGCLVVSATARYMYLLTLLIGAVIVVVCLYCLTDDDCTGQPREQAQQPDCRPRCK